MLEDWAASTGSPAVLRGLDGMMSLWLGLTVKAEKNTCILLNLLILHGLRVYSTWVEGGPENSRGLLPCGGEMEMSAKERAATCSQPVSAHPPASHRPT